MTEYSFLYKLFACGLYRDALLEDADVEILVRSLQARYLPSAVFSTIS
jgi:hypothetical protein